MYKLDLENQGVLGTQADGATISAFGKQSRCGNVVKTAKQASQNIQKDEMIDVLHNNSNKPMFVPKEGLKLTKKPKPGSRNSHGYQGNQGGSVHKRTPRKVREIYTCQMCKSSDHRNFLTCPNIK